MTSARFSAYRLPGWTARPPGAELPGEDEAATLPMAGEVHSRPDHAQDYRYLIRCGCHGQWTAPVDVFRGCRREEEVVLSE